MFEIILTPKEEVDCYATLPVQIGNVVHRVAITKYRCANLRFGKSAQHGGTQDAVVFKDRLLHASRKKGIRILREMSPGDYVGVFLGKGSRRNIIQVLQWVERCGLLDSKLHKGPALQKICDDYIGLDCNGFVGNWASENCVQSIGPSTPPSGMGHVFRKARRTSLQEIRPFDIFVWNDHVASVHSIGPVEARGHVPLRRAMVAESYGAIMCKERVIRAAHGTGYFHVGGHNWAAAEAFGVGLQPVGPIPADATAVRFAVP